jgi:hypothetical protein
MMASERMEKNISPGSRVRLKGLASRPDLNGAVAVVLSPSSDKEAEKLSSQGRIKVTGFPVALSVKRSNVVPIFDDKVDWTFADKPPLSILDIVQGSLSDTDRCDDLENAVYGAIAQGAPKPPYIWLPEVVPAILNNCSPHCVYFLALDQIGHHFILETHQGLARMYQSYIKDKMTLGDTDMVMNVTGYTAGEWVAKKPNAAWCPKMVACHQRWGRGRLLNHSSLRELMDLVGELQECAAQIAEAMVATAPKALQEAQAKYEVSIAAGQQTNAYSPIVQWSAKLLDTPWHAGLISNGSAGDTIVDNPSATEPFHFFIKPALSQKFHRLHEKLTGQEVSAPVYLKVMNCHKCERMKGIHQATGKLSAIGWGVIAAQIPH